MQAVNVINTLSVTQHCATKCFLYIINNFLKISLISVHQIVDPHDQGEAHLLIVVVYTDAAAVLLLTSRCH